MAVIEEETPNSNKTRSAGYNNSDGYESATDTELNDAVPDSKIISDSTTTNHTHLTNGDEKAVSEANDAKLEGNSLFKVGLFEDALSKYEFAIQVAPDAPSSTEIRSICYANRAACYSHLGKFEETVKECTKALELNPTYVKALLRRGEAREKLQLYEESMADMTKVLELDQSNDQARRTIIRLKPLADEKREKMKEEMIGKLKEMGNSVLGRFGMSVDNFKAVKDPNTGSYSLSFQQ